jgi:hypothetical protein
MKAIVTLITKHEFAFCVLAGKVNGILRKLILFLKIFRLIFTIFYLAFLQLKMCKDVLNFFHHAN